MVLVVPVLELHAVDVAAAQELHLLFYHSRLVFRAVERGHKAIAWEAGPVAGDIHSNGTQHHLDAVLAGAIDIHQISGEVGGGCRPRPGGSGGSGFVHHIDTVAIADLGPGGQRAFCGEGDSLAGLVASLVGTQINGQVRGNGDDFSHAAGFASAGFVTSTGRSGFMITTTSPKAGGQTKYG